MIPTLLARPPSSAANTFDNSAGRSTTHSGTSNSGGTSIFGCGGKTTTHIAAPALASPTGTLSTAAHKLARSRPWPSRTATTKELTATNSAAAKPSANFLRRPTTYGYH